MRGKGGEGAGRLRLILSFEGVSVERDVCCIGSRFFLFFSFFLFTLYSFSRNRQLASS